MTDYRSQIKYYQAKHIYLSYGILNLFFGKRIIISDVKSRPFFYKYVGLYSISISDNVTSVTLSDEANIDKDERNDINITGLSTVSVITDPIYDQEL